MLCPCGKPIDECAICWERRDNLFVGDCSLFTAAELGLDPEEDDAYISIYPVSRDWREL